MTDEQEILNHPGFPLYAKIVQRLYKSIDKVPKFSDNFSHYLFNLLSYPGAPEEDRVNTVVNIFKTYEALKEDIKHARKEYDTEQIVRSSYQFIDAKVQANLQNDGNRSTCKRGCSYCCHLNVGIGKGEAKILSKDLSHDQIQHLKKQRDVLTKLGKDNYEDFPHEVDWETSACVFLKNNECSVYEDRPMACRMYYVVTEPKLCDVISNKDGKTGQLVTYEAEIMRAVITHYYHNKPMPIYILQERGE